MQDLLKKYESKLINQGLCNEGGPLIGALDDEMEWNSQGDRTTILENIARDCSFSAILYSDLKEPLRSMINSLCRNLPTDKTEIEPDDTETRTFLHSIPVIWDFDRESIVAALKKRKGVIIPDRGIVTYGTISPEQAFVTFSSICFSCYVKFMTDFYLYKKGGLFLKEAPAETALAALKEYGKQLDSFSDFPSFSGKFTTADEVIESIIETGRLTVESGMVDSFFGNISVRFNDTIYISQTGSSLDELRGLIDPCPMDNSRSNAITSSSEFSAHKGIYSMWNHRTILHGHPRFSVIVSLLCDKRDCPNKGLCHINCSERRFLNDIPIIPGEVGTGPRGIATTLPPAMEGRGAIVYGHGLFTTGKENFTEAFRNLIDIERTAFLTFMESIGAGNN